MRSFRKFGSAFTLSVLIASGMMAFSASVNASDGGSITNASICRLLDAAEAFFAGLPDSKYKTAILNYIEQQEAKYGCQ